MRRHIVLYLLAAAVLGAAAGVFAAEPLGIRYTCPSLAAETPAWVYYPPDSHPGWPIPGCTVEGQAVTPSLVQLACPVDTVAVWSWIWDGGPWEARAPGRGDEMLAVDLSAWYRALTPRPIHVGLLSVECREPGP